MHLLLQTNNCENYIIKVTTAADPNKLMKSLMSNQRIGIFDNTPEYTLDVTGDIPQVI